jgi:acetylornithine/N-succinyldiaminopimelate aminotransferase
MTIQERESRYFFHTYKRIPLEIERGEGVFLYTKEGKRYLDMFSGLAVNALGYSHPKIVRAIVDQTNKYTHVSNYYLQEPQVKLAELLAEHSGYSRVFFSNSGTEAVEGAIKIARQWGSARGKTTIVSFSNAFHGRTMGALSMMDRPKYRDGFGPFLDHFQVVEFNDSQKLCSIVNEQTLAIVLEFIQGEGGIYPVSHEFASTLNSLQEEFGCLIIADEIQSGLGRTGRFFGFQHFGAKPDIVVIAKPIGGGLPLGAILGGPKVVEVLEPGMHGTTFGGNPVACAAGIAVMEELTAGGLMERAERMGHLLKRKLDALKSEFPSLVREVRGYGLMVGMELTRECESIVTALREHRILLNCTNQNVLRFLPPLIVEEQHIEETVEKLQEIMSGLH